MVRKSKHLISDMHEPMMFVALRPRDTANKDANVNSLVNRDYFAQMATLVAKMCSGRSSSILTRTYMLDNFRPPVKN